MNSMGQHKGNLHVASKEHVSDSGPVAALRESIRIREQMLSDVSLLHLLEQISREIVNRFQKGNKVLFCGNGGSAADAQHLAAELSGRFCMDRSALFAEALSVNTSYLTAVANDYSFDDVFSRLVEGMGRRGDVLVAISTSGGSSNVVKALEAARKIGMVTVGLTGSVRSPMNALCRYLVKIPSANTARIQETHIMVGHMICEMVERALFNGEA